MTAEVRRAAPADLDAIVAVETAAFDAPWTREVYAQEFDRDLARVLVAVDHGDGEIHGVACWWHVVDEAHLLRVAVRPHRRRQGIGTALLERVLADAAAAGCAHVDLEVGRRNTAALALYARGGFVEVGLRRGYYQHPVDDAVLLRAVLSAADRARGAP